MVSGRARRIENFDQPLERNIGVREGPEIGFALAHQQVGERLARVDARPEDQRY